MTDTAWDYIFVLWLLTIVGAVLCMVSWQINSTIRSNRQARTREQLEFSYREIAERAVLAQEDVAAQMKVLHEHVADLRARVTSIERMLREVE